jgi:hypothetical protein
VHTTFAPSNVPLFPTSPGAQRCGPTGFGGGLGWTTRTAGLGTTVVVGSTKVVVVVGRVLSAVIEGADVGATVEGAAVVDVGAEVDGGDAVEFFAIALASPFGALEQAAVPRPNTTSAETVTNLNFRIQRSISPAHGACRSVERGDGVSLPASVEGSDRQIAEPKATLAQVPQSEPRGGTRSNRVQSGNPERQVPETAFRQ